MSKRSETALVDVFSALGDGTRLSLIAKLSDSPQTATSLAEDGPVTRQAIVKHLQVLENAGLVSNEKHGRQVLYTLDLRRLNDAKVFIEATSAKWDGAISRLRQLVEQLPSKNRT